MTLSHVPTPDSNREPRLSPNDQRLLDGLMEAGFDRNAMGDLSADESNRVDALLSTLDLLNDYPVEDADETLLHATMARIDRHEDELAARMKFDARQDAIDQSTRGGRRIRLPDFLTVAAIILIGVSVCWPMLNSLKQHSIDTGCANNLKHLGYAFGQYASDNKDALPLATAGIGSWDTIQNAVNLKPLLEGNYCEHGHLNCPGHANHAEGANGVGSSAGPSYSYRMFMPGENRPTGWGVGRVTVVIGDLNPIIEAARRKQFLPPLSMSLNHNGRGQNVLSTDGAVLWLEHPVIGPADNIWLPNGSERLRGGDRPQDPADVFLAH